MIFSLLQLHTYGICISKSELQDTLFNASQSILLIHRVSHTIFESSPKYYEKHANYADGTD